MSARRMANIPLCLRWIMCLKLKLKCLPTSKLVIEVSQVRYWFFLIVEQVYAQEDPSISQRLESKILMSDSPMSHVIAVDGSKLICKGWIDMKFDSRECYWTASIHLSKCGPNLFQSYRLSRSENIATFISLPNGHGKRWKFFCSWSNA